MEPKLNNNDGDNLTRGGVKKVFTVLILVLSLAAGIIVSFSALRRDLSNIDLRSLMEASSVWVSSWYWMVGALVCLLLILLTGAFRIHVLLKPKQQRITLRDSYRFSLLSKYYVLITPFGLGGQPITMVFMRRKKIPFSLATFVPMIDLFAMRLSMLIIGLSAIIFFPNVVVPWVRIGACIGILFSCFLPVFSIAMSWFPIFERVIVSLLSALKFLKRRNQYISTIKDAFFKYRSAFTYFKTMKKRVVVVFILAMISQLALLSIPFFILKAYPTTLTFNDLNVPFTYSNSVAMVAYASIAAAFVPTVGNAGAIEFSFSTVFASFLEAQYLFWALFAWRFFTFYIFLLLGLALTAHLGINRRRELRRHHLPDFSKQPLIVLFSDNFFPVIDGVVRTVDAYARNLQALGWNPLVIVPNYKKTDEALPYQVLHVPSLRIPKQEYALGIFRFSKAIRNALEYDGPIIYHTHAPFFIAHKALRHARANNIPIVTTFHSKYYEDFYENLHSKTLSQMAVNYIVRFYRQVDEVWAVSRKTAMTLKNYGYRGDVFIMPNGSDFVIPDDIESYRMQAIQFLDIKDDEPTLLFVGHLIWQKNIKFMFEVLRHLDSEGFKYHMIFIGEGGHEKMVKKYYESLNLAGRVTFGGGVRDRYLLAGIFVASDLFFFPSVYDNAPLVIREAASAGLPSLLARGSHSAEVVVDNVSGFTERLDAEKMAARIIDLFKNPKLLKEVGEAAKTTIPTTWSVFVKQAIERYQQVMERYYRYEE